ncbi:cyclin-d-binding MYB-like protein transcription factor 1-like protein [Trifolium pratense]|uniref:Cyclin-d-binding MYB-like protein transcription factor 1-like protein n=1 Tax=Trifolium pratense TaxID=57577 RepID=A0A2K3NQ45_TRIPR|nr:cyclin-d-binding MYB-like protein transcription factor 1-like protein [Trifolium pratense]
MLVEGNTPEECNDHFRSNVDEDGKLDKKVKKKKKKLSEESKLKEFESNECEDDNQGKKMKKKQKLIEGNTLKECNDFRSNGDEDGKQDKKMKKKKKKLSEKSNHKEYTEFESNECEDDQGKKMKKKRKLIEGNTLNECNDFRNNRGEDGEQDKKMKKKKKKLSEESKHKEYSEFKSNESKPKRVTFSDEVETFSCDGLVRGKRFTPEEDEKLKASVFDYIDSHGLGEEGLDKVLHSRSHPEVHGCWKEIARVLPRSRRSVYDRGHVLLEHIGRCKWTPDELEFIRKSYEQHGPNYRLIADALGKSRDQAIGHKLETRNSAFCCKKWYEELTSPMVASDDWSDTDDFRLIDSLYTLDACCMEEVDWDELIEHRSGDLCRKRWDQMVQHLGEHARKPFIEQVEVLTKRFCPDLLEAREAFDNKPVIC